MDHDAAHSADKSDVTGETLVIIRLLSLIGITAFAILASNASSAAEGLGRLFFNPEQRAQMDLARSKRIRTTLAEEPTEQQSTALPETVLYNGLVRRSDGKNTIWLNGRSVPEGEMGGHTTVNSTLRRDGSLVIELPQANRSINLRVGQELEITSGSIAESYARTAPLANSATRSGPGSPKPAATVTPRNGKAATNRTGTQSSETRKGASEAKPAAVENSGSSKTAGPPQ